MQRFTWFAQAALKGVFWCQFRLLTQRCPSTNQPDARLHLVEKYADLWAFLIVCVCFLPINFWIFVFLSREWFLFEFHLWSWQCQIKLPRHFRGKYCSFPPQDLVLVIHILFDLIHLDKLFHCIQYIIFIFEDYLKWNTWKSILYPYGSASFTFVFAAFINIIVDFYSNTVRFSTVVLFLY